MAQKRVAITTEQKVALRAFCNSDEGHSASHKHLQQWFQQQYQRPISQSSISEILSNRYNDLDTPTSSTKPASKRRKIQAWPEVETALHEWQLRMQDRITITGDILKCKAAFFFERIPQYQGVEMPQFSNGWLAGFKSRHKVKRYVQHGEAGDVDLAAVQQPDVETIQQALIAYDPNDVFNCDETAVYWKRVPDRSLSTQPLSGRKKKEKARITAHLCCNATGTEKLPIWFIGTAKRPLAFRAANVNIEAMDLVWRHNAAAWMTATIMEEWLLWFDRRMKDRKVILLMDNFSAHELALSILDNLPSGQGLKNTRIIWLPPNSTSVYQPLEQGIINTWKAYYRRYWLQYMLEEVESFRDPIKTMNVLKAIRWGSRSWAVNMQPSTIANCFNKTTLLVKRVEEATTSKVQQDEAVEKQIQQDIEKLQAVRYIHDAMDIQNFLNSVEEVVQDSQEEIEEQILGQFGPEIEAESDEEIEELPIISPDDAIEALSRLRLYEEQAEDGNPDWITRLDRFERVVKARQFKSLKQRDIRTFFNTSS